MCLFCSLNVFIDEFRLKADDEAAAPVVDVVEVVRSPLVVIWRSADLCLICRTVFGGNMLPAALFTSVVDEDDDEDIVDVELSGGFDDDVLFGIVFVIVDEDDDDVDGVDDVDDTEGWLLIRLIMLTCFSFSLYDEG